MSGLMRKIILKGTFGSNRYCERRSTSIRIRRSRRRNSSFYYNCILIEDSGAYSIDSFEEMEEHGGFLLEIPLLDTASAIERLEEEYELTEEQIELLQLVYKKKSKVQMRKLSCPKKK